ncbi:MAG: MurNAc alpha-1-phosphate uridylyltransferase [Paraglaciecola sp.]|jgi:MurNAc alpha-1-phosphate uridylyltransferase
MIKKTAMILAAGRGERMRPLTDTIPKPLLVVKHKPLIEHHIDGLKKAGYQRIVINHAWLGEQIVSSLGDGKRFGLELQYCAEKSAFETAGGIVNALPLLCPDQQDEYFTVVSADIYTDFDFSSLPATLGGNSAHLVMVANPAHHPMGDFYLNNGKMHESEGEKLTFSGIAVFHRRFFNSLIEQKIAVMRIAPMLINAIKNGLVSGHKHQTIWSDVGTPERLAILNSSGVIQR